MNQKTETPLAVGSRVRITAINTEFHGKIGIIKYLSRPVKDGRRGAGIVFSAEDNPEYPRQAYWFMDHEWMAL